MIITAAFIFAAATPFVAGSLFAVILGKTAALGDELLGEVQEQERQQACEGRVHQGGVR